MVALRCDTTVLDPVSRAFYQQAMRKLQEREVGFLVGGAYSFARYTGIERHTKDFDIFLLEGDRGRALQALAELGCHTEIAFPHWLAKAHSGENFIDVIWSSGNGIARVDERWFQNSVEATVLEIPVRLCPVEETIWSKAFVMERERYDGADIAHLLRASGRQMNWDRLLERFRPHWRVLFSYLVLYGFVYPGERDVVPPWVLERLIALLQAEMNGPALRDRICQGTLFSRAQYLVDVEHWGYQDARLHPDGAMSQHEISHWTAAIDDEKPTQAVRPTFNGGG